MRQTDGPVFYSNTLHDLFVILDTADQRKPNDPLLAGVNFHQMAIETALGYIPDVFVCPIQIVPGNEPLCAASAGTFEVLYALRPELMPVANFANQEIRYGVQLTRYTDNLYDDLKQQEPVTVRLKHQNSAQDKLLITTGLAEQIGGNARIKVWDEESKSIVDVGGVELKNGDLVILQLISAVADQQINLATL